MNISVYYKNKSCIKHEYQNENVVIIKKLTHFFTYIKELLNLEIDVLLFFIYIKRILELNRLVLIKVVVCGKMVMFLQKRYSYA